MSEPKQSTIAGPPASPAAGSPVEHRTGASRSQALLGVAAGLIVLVVVVVVFVVVRRPDPPPTAASEAPVASAAPAAPSAPAPPGQISTSSQAVPPGVDPALGKRPPAGKGGAALTALVVTPLVKGSGPAVTPGQVITVNYVGASYTTGDEFEASWDTGKPVQFQIGVGQVIPGWDQGLVGVPVGSRVQLDIPANLAYGDNPQGGGPTGPLRFIVDLLGAKAGQ
jgi:peptidylprolyl isomerase